MANGAWLALGAAALAAGAARAASARGRGSADKALADKASAPVWERPEVREAASQIAKRLGLKDVRVGEKDTLYLLASVKKLESLLHGSGRWGVQQLLASSGLDKNSLRSYVDNLIVWDGLSDAVKAYLSGKGVQANPAKEYDEWTIEVVPEPGRPRGRTWSVAKGKVLSEQPVKPFRFCDQPPVSLGSPLGPALVDFSEKGLPPFFLSHGVTFEGLAEVETCGGFLWPSFALTWRVPEGYGDVVFLADAGLLASLVKPSGSPGKRKDVYLAGTDIWSPTAKELARTQAQIAKQLRGQSDRGVQDRLLLSSATKADWDNLVGTFSYDEHNVGATDRIQTRKALVQAARGILAEHVEGDDVYVYPGEKNRRYQAKHRYPYAEMKVAGVVKPADMVACLYPKASARRVHALLDKLGFQGFRIPFDWAGGPRKDWDHDEKRHIAWASAATQALQAWAKRPCATPGVRVGSAPQNPEIKSRYEAEFSFYNGFMLRGGHGPFAWSSEPRGRCLDAKP